jgi:hypothetical protein
MSSGSVMVFLNAGDVRVELLPSSDRGMGEFKAPAEGADISNRPDPSLAAMPLLCCRDSLGNDHAIQVSERSCLSL